VTDRKGIRVAGTAQRQQGSHRWVWIAALFTGGLALVLFGAGIALDSNTSRVEKFGLSDLVDGPASDGRILTPSEEARERFNDNYRTNYKSESRAEISGTKLMLRAIRELDPRQREIRIEDTVRLLRANPQAKAKVYAMVDTYLANNPQMAAYGAEVKRAVESLLGEPPKRRLDFLEY
jgi:hypothetical protein